MFSSLQEKCQNPAVLLSILQRFLAIPHDKPESNRLWPYIDQVVEKIAVLDPKQTLVDCKPHILVLMRQCLWVTMIFVK